AVRPARRCALPRLAGRRAPAAQCATREAVPASSPRSASAGERGGFEPGVDSRGDLGVALRVRRLPQLVLADAAELGDERALRRVAPEQRRDPDRVRRELIELRVELALAAVPPEVPPLVGAARPHAFAS